MIICSRPECQTTAGCKCVARTGEPLEPERLKAAILVRDTELQRLRDEIAALRAQILADEEMINTLRAENEAQKQALRDQLTARKHNEAENERLKKECWETFEHNGWCASEIARLRAALVWIEQRVHEGSEVHIKARAALGGEGK